MSVLKGIAEKIDGYKTFYALWLPVVASLCVLMGWQITGFDVAGHAAPGVEGWLTWFALLGRAVDQTCMRLAIKKTEAKIDNAREVKGSAALSPGKN